jgi:hypothetical protein
MPPTKSSVPELQILMSGLAFGESPRWHEDRLWFSDWGAHEVIAVDLEGRSEVIVRVPSFPLCLGFLPDGRLLIVSASDGLLLRREADGSLVTHADLTGLSDHNRASVGHSKHSSPELLSHRATKEGRSLASAERARRWPGNPMETAMDTVMTTPCIG